jgi:hypothetical protein
LAFSFLKLARARAKKFPFLAPLHPTATTRLPASPLPKTIYGETEGRQKLFADFFILFCLHTMHNAVMKANFHSLILPSFSFIAFFHLSSLGAFTQQFP